MPTLEAMTFIDLIMHLHQAFVFYKNAWQKRPPGEGHMQNITLMNNAFVLSRQRGFPHDKRRYAGDREQEDW